MNDQTVGKLFAYFQNIIANYSNYFKLNSICVFFWPGAQEFIAVGTLHENELIIKTLRHSLSLHI